jgi:hypothetical protein
MLNDEIGVERLDMPWTRTYRMRDRKTSELVS